MTLSLGILGYGTLSNEKLAQTIRRSYPDEACAHVLEHRYAGPLYNQFDWGGYLIWRLRDADPPLRVGMDGRTIVYPEELILQQIRTWQGDSDWVNDPNLKSAKLVIARRDAALTSLLRCRPSEFKLVHEDSLAVVFVRRYR